MQSLPPALGPSAAAPLVSVADQAVIQAELADPALVGPLLAILQNPVGTQRPDLQHFDPVAAGRLTSGGAAPAAVVRTAAGVLAISVALASVLPLLGLGARRRAALLLIPAALAGGAGVAVAGVPAGAPAPVVSPHALPDRVLAAPPGGHARAPAAESAWSELLLVESRLASEHRLLLADESEIASTTQSLTAADPADLTPARQRAVADRLQLLVARHAATLLAYDATLQDEYLIYRSAAETPALAAQLSRGAEGARPQARAAVTADLGILATQLRQEAAIAAAEQRLRQLGFSAAQRLALQSRDAFIAPAGGPIGQPFGPTSVALEPPLEYQGTFYPHFHTGVDIDASLDTPVQAAMAGVVALVASSTDGRGHSTGYGNYVLIEHGHGYATLYAHLDRVLVTAGAVVAQGQPIGLVGSTGNSTGPHLHFEIRRDGGFVDPLPYLAGSLRPW